MPDQARLLGTHKIFKNEGWPTEKSTSRNITKAIYGTLLGAILFYKKLKRVLTDMGFQTNRYNEFTFNKMIKEMR